MIKGYERSVATSGRFASIAKYQLQSRFKRLYLCVALAALSAGIAAHAQGLPSTPIGTIPAEAYWANTGPFGQALYFSTPLAACTYISDVANNVQYRLYYYDNPRTETPAGYGLGCEFDLQSASTGQWTYNVYENWVGPQPVCPPNYNGPMIVNGTTVCQAKSTSNPWFPQKNQCGVGDPIFPCAGIQFESAVDIPRLSSGLELTRHYLSGPGNGVGSDPRAAFGHGWYFRYGTFLTFGNTSSGAIGSVFATRPDGTGAIFVPNGSGGWESKADTDDELSDTTDSSGNIIGWNYFDAATEDTEQYDTAGKLLSITKRGGDVLEMTYSTATTPSSVSTYSNKLIEVSDPFGRSISFTYNSAGLVATATDPAGNAISYSYNSNGILASVAYPDNSSLTYEYNESQYMGGGSSAQALTGITDQNDTRYAIFNYNSGGQVVGTQLSGGVNRVTLALGTNQSTVTDALGGTRTYASQVILGISRPTSIAQSCSSGCNSATATITYDANGNVSSRTDFDGNLTCYLYDLSRNLEVVRVEGFTPGSSCPTNLATYTPASSTAQRKITTSWDSTYRLPTQVAEAIRTTSFTYDSSGSLLTKTITDLATTATRTWTYTYDSYGRILTADGPRTDVSDVTTYAYYTCATGSQCGELQTITDALGHITTYNTYDADGRPLTITEPNGVVTTLTYDSRGHLKTRSASGETTSFSYYPTGLLEQVTLPDGSSLSYTYDAAHRLTQLNNGLGNKIVYTLDAMGNRTAENTYDTSGTLHRTHTRVINTLNEIYQEVNAAGTSAVTTTFGYDNDGNPTSIAAPLSRNTGEGYDALNRVSSITDPGNGVTTFGYDAEDNLTSVKDPRSLITSYGYDGFGDLTSQVSPDTGTTSNTYDSAGNLATGTDARGAVATYGYDALNRVTSIAYSLNGTTDQTLSFTYDQGSDGVGHLTGVSDANHSMTFTHDALGEMTGMSQTAGGVTRSVVYGYTNGDLTTVTTPSGQAVTYGYNANHEVTSIAVNGTTVLSNVSYEPFGPVDGWTWSNGTSFSRSFNGDGEITGVTSPGIQETLTYDDASRITALSNATPGASSWTYGYDLLDRLTSATSSAITQGWTYDENGNRLTETGNFYPSTYSISPTSNQITQTTGAIAGTTTYDAAGNGITFGPSPTDTYGYNDRGRMSSVSYPGGYTESLAYDAFGRLLLASGASANEILVYDQADHLLGEYDTSGNLMQETVWLGDIPVATLRPNGSGGIDIYDVHTDHLATPRTVTRPSDNKIVWQWDSDPFGVAAPNEDPSGLGSFLYNLRFPGQVLFFNGARIYDSIIGRYDESDPLGLAGGSYSTYAYALNNPISNDDTDGQQAAVGAGVGTLVEPGLGTVIGAAIGVGIEAAAVYEVCKDHKCPPCKTVSGKIVPLGTIAYRPLDTPPPGKPEHGIEGPHHNIYMAHQNPKNCQCFWQPIGAVAPADLPPGAIPIEPFAN
jgi:RHS repeat-associated protein